ncbi:tetratricopeptide repeat protein 22 isoform X1 [Bufo gargarizans]|uniref:tetratricopeptide repeat protein 22 isoform X1 n=1 Tax=Bufo gargarizans TaxID=30331 RepID=UPI001CF2E425|nr:tetratricopeptide repeat protein 22 isoform X1 [Bufo gargarizans]
MEEEPDVDIETLIDEFEYIPGYFHLEMNLNFESCTPPHLRRRDIKLKQEALQFQLEVDSSFQHFGIRNLSGVFSFYLDEVDKAKEIFINICNQDPNNLNAWANLAYVYDKLNMEEEASQSVDKLSHLMDLDTHGDRHMAARCLAEQGYAHAFDVGQMTDKDNMEKLITGISLYDKAVTYGKHKISIEEKRSWFFTMASLCMRLDEILIKKEHAGKKRLQFYNKTLMLLREAVKSSNNQYKALSWCYIGMMLEKQHSFPTTPMGIHDYGFSGTDALDCFSKAIEIGKGDPLILNRLAKIFHFLGKQEMATGICNMALSALQDPKLNWQAYCTRSQIFIWMYVRDLERAKLGLGGLPDRNHLTNAKCDLESIIDVYPCLKTYLDMGQVYYYMGVDAVQGLMLIDEDSINHALVCIAKAMEYDLADTLPELQLLKGKCLQVKGEELNASECFKKAIELESKGSQATETFRHLMEALLGLYGHTKMDAETLIQEVEFWVKEAQQKYEVESVSQELQTVCRNNTTEIVNLSKAMIAAGKMDLVRLLFQSMMVKPRMRLSSRSSSF